MWGILQSGVCLTSLTWFTNLLRPLFNDCDYTLNSWGTLVLFLKRKIYFFLNFFLFLQHFYPFVIFLNWNVPPSLWIYIIDFNYFEMSLFCFDGAIYWKEMIRVNLVPKFIGEGGSKLDHIIFLFVSVEPLNYVLIWLNWNP